MNKTINKFFKLKANGTLLFTECGNIDPAIFQLKHALSLMTDSNELSIRFLTQNTNEVVYSGHIDQASDRLDTSTAQDASSVHVYRGFLFYYSFVEEPGDCYFQERGSNFMCGYESIAGAKWLVTKDKDTVDVSSPEQLEFEKYFCTSCYLSSHIPANSAGESSILASPVIEKTMLALRFDYRMPKPANLLVILIQNQDYENKKFDRSMLIKKIDNVTTGDAWSTMRVKLGNHLLHNYRVLFTLDRLPGQSAPATVHIDNIQFFENDFECAMRMDDDQSCIAPSLLNSLSGICQKYSTPCDQNNCQNGAFCLNKNQVEANQIAQKTNDDDDNESEDYVCICPHGFTGKKYFTDFIYICIYHVKIFIQIKWYKSVFNVNKVNYNNLFPLISHYYWFENITC